MGGRSGKFVVPHEERTTEEAQETAVENPAEIQELDVSNKATTEAAPPVVNGHPEGDHVAENEQTEITADQANGTISASETQPDATDVSESKTPKKSRNPIVWLQRRISKKSLGFKKHTCEKSNAEDNQESAPDATEEVPVPAPTTETDKPDDSPADVAVTHEDSIAGVADSLVEEVITSATVAREAIPSEAETNVQPSNIDSPPEQIPVELEQPEPPKEEVVVPDTSVNGEYVCEDTNNTNVENHDFHEEIPVTDPTHIDVTAKLASLELTNGHVEHQELLDGMECDHSVVAINGTEHVDGINGVE